MHCIHVRRGVCRSYSISIGEDASATCTVRVYKKREVYLHTLLFSLTKTPLRHSLFACKESCM
jgi:hypothetical protein